MVRSGGSVGDRAKHDGSEETRPAQRQLYCILCSRSSRQKKKEAEGLYRVFWQKGGTEELSTWDAWVMEKGHELAVVLAKQSLLPKVEVQFDSVLRARCSALGDER